MIQTFILRGYYFFVSKYLDKNDQSTRLLFSDGATATFIKKISEDNIVDPLREVQLALLDADVNFKVAKGFIARVKEQSLGEDVLASVQPGQMIVKIIHDERVALLGDTIA